MKKCHQKCISANKDNCEWWHDVNWNDYLEEKHFNLFVLIDLCRLFHSFFLIIIIIIYLFVKLFIFMFLCVEGNEMVHLKRLVLDILKISNRGKKTCERKRVHSRFLMCLFCIMRIVMGSCFSNVDVQKETNLQIRKVVGKKCTWLKHELTERSNLLWAEEMSRWLFEHLKKEKMMDLFIALI